MNRVRQIYFTAKARVRKSETIVRRAARRFFIANNLSQSAGMSKKKLAGKDRQRKINRIRATLFLFADGSDSFLKLFRLFVRSVEMTL